MNFLYDNISYTHYKIQYMAYSCIYPSQIDAVSRAGLTVVPVVQWEGAPYSQKTDGRTMTYSERERVKNRYSSCVYPPPDGGVPLGRSP